MEFFGPVLLLVFLVNKTVDWLRDLIPDPLEGKVLIPVSMGIGAAYTFAFSATEWAPVMGVGDMTLADLNVVAVLLAGAGVGAGGSVLNDLKPQRLSQAQMERVVEKADTVVVEAAVAEVPVPAKPKRTRRS